MIATTRPLTTQALYTGVSTSAGGTLPRGSVQPVTSLPAPSGQRIPNTENAVRLVGKSNRRVVAPRSHGGSLAL